MTYVNMPYVVSDICKAFNALDDVRSWRTILGAEGYHIVPTCACTPVLERSTREK